MSFVLVYSALLQSSVARHQRIKEFQKLAKFHEDNEKYYRLEYSIIKESILDFEKRHGRPPSFSNRREQEQNEYLEKAERYMKLKVYYQSKISGE
jgi:hypothetical protein